MLDTNPLLAQCSRVLKHRPEPYLKTNHQEWRATFSTDGRWVAYSSNESGQFAVYIEGYPDKRGKWLVSASGGLITAWRGNGKELYWTELDMKLMAAGIESTGDGVRVGRPQALFRLPINDPYSYFQPSRDGHRFLVYEPPSTATQQHSMVVIQNWARGWENEVMSLSSGDKLGPYDAVAPLGAAGSARCNAPALD